jgi:hypothetical protein
MLVKNKIMFLALSFNFTSDCKWALFRGRFTNTKHKKFIPEVKFIDSPQLLSCRTSSIVSEIQISPS